jgi:hypothetical protein
MIAAVLSAAALNASPMLATGLSASELAVECLSKHTWARASCSRYLSGASEMLAVWNSFGGDSPLADICPPRPLWREDIRAAFLRYLRDHPDEGGRPAALVINVAIGSAYPCPSR